MNSLFPTEPAMPNGFHYYPDFITDQEEEQLLELMPTFGLQTLIFQGFEAKRKVESYGYSYHFDTRTITKGKSIPEGLLSIVMKVAVWLSLPDDAIGQILVTEYPPGSVINWHRDAPPFDIIIGLSLLSECTFKLRPYDKAKQGKKAILSKILRPRSLYVIQDEARTDWEHSTVPVKETRYSITFRTLRAGYG